MATMNEDLDFDFSQLDDTLISDQQKQTLLDYINQIKSQKRSINEEFNQFKLSTEQRFHELAREYDTVHNEVVKQREIESQLRTENEQLRKISNEIDEQLTTIRQNEQLLTTKFETTMEQVRQLSAEREQLKNIIDEKEKENYELQKQRESLEEENRQVHNTNNATITRLQELENTSSQLHSLELLWNKERGLYTDQLQTLGQSLIESKRLSTDQQTQIMQLTVQLESSDGQLQAQKRSLDMGIDEKNEAILNIDRQLREKTQRIEQLQTDLQRTIRQMENQQITTNKTIQSLKTQIDELLKKNSSITEKYDEQNQLLVKISSERDVIKTEMRTLVETFERQSTENDQTIRRLQDELDNTTQLLESIRSKGADLTQLTNFLDGTLSHIRSTDPSSTPLSTTVKNKTIINFV
jgi:DNA repair exonuclease SbcCD ATPase subunit